MADPRQAAGLGNMLSQYGTPPEVVERWGVDPAAPGGIFDQYQRDVNAPYGSTVGSGRDRAFLSGDLNAGIRAGQTQDAALTAQRMRQMIESMTPQQRQFYDSVNQPNLTPQQRQQRIGIYEQKFGTGSFPR